MRNQLGTDKASRLILYNLLKKWNQPENVKFLTVLSLFANICGLNAVSETP